MQKIKRKECAKNVYTNAREREMEQLTGQLSSGAGGVDIGLGYQVSRKLGKACSWVALVGERSG